MFYLAKILFAEAEQRCAIKFRVAANVIIGVRMQFSAVGVAPKLLRVVSATAFTAASSSFLSRAAQMAALNQQNFLAARCKVIGQSAATCARTDDDEIVIAPVVHTDWSQCNPNPYAILESPDLFDENSRIDDPAYPGRIDEFLKEVMSVCVAAIRPGERSVR